MGQIEYRAWKKMKNVQEKAKRNPYLSAYKENAIEAEINWYKAKEEERENEEISKKIWGF